MENGEILLFPLVVSRQSADPLNIIQSPFYNDNQNTNTKNDLGGSKNETGENKNECKPKENKETIEQNLLTITKSFTIVLLRVEIHPLFSKFLFIKITSLPEEKETPKILFLSAMCCKHHPSPTYNPTWTTYQGKH